MFDFPTNPPPGTPVTTPDGAVRYWDGQKWDAAYSGGGPPGARDASNDLSTAQGATAARTLANRFADRYSARDWGVVSDGTTDDYAALNAAIAAVLAMPYGGVLTLPVGRTVVGTAITANVPAGKALTIEGMGPLASELYFSNATNGLGFTLLCSGSTWGAVSLHAFSVTRGPTSPQMDHAGITISADHSMAAICNARMSFRDLVIQGSNPGSAATNNQWLQSMVLNSTCNTTLDNVHIKGADATSTDQGDALLTINGQTGPDPGTGPFKQFAVSNNIVNCGLHGGSVGLLITGFVQGVFIVNTTIIGQYDGVRWASTQAQFPEELCLSNCTMNAIHRGVLATWPDQCSITGTTILHFYNSLTGLAADFAGIEFDNVAYCAVIGNNIVGTVAGATEHGIIWNNCYVGNTCIGNATDVNGMGVHLTGSTTGVTVIGNNASGGAGAVAQTAFGNVIVANAWNGIAGVLTTAQPMAFVSNAGLGPRWFVGSDNTTEGSGNTGNNFEIVSVDNNGTLIAAALTITRSNGFIGFGTVFNASNDAAAAVGGVALNGVYRNGSVLMIRTV